MVSPGRVSPVTDIHLSDIFPDARRYVWLGRDYRHPGAGATYASWHETPAPQPGDSVPADEFSGMADAGEHASGRYARTLAAERQDGGVEFVEIPYTVSGDYVGSLYERANCQGLREDYPGVFVTVYSSYRTDWLVARADTVLDDDETDLPGVLAALLDYPVYDDERASMLEQELISEAWDDWAQYDIRRAMREILAARGDTDTDEVDIPIGTLGDYFDLCETVGRYPYAEDASNVVFDPSLEDYAATRVALWTVTP
jgi:hypothetical protein